MDQQKEQNRKDAARGIRLNELFDNISKLTRLPPERKKQALAILCAIAGFIGVLSFLILEKIF